MDELTPTPAPTTAPDQLRAWRRWKGLTQAEAAALVPVSQGTWSDWEAGAKTPGVRVANRLHSLGICAVWLWGEVSPPDVSAG